MFGNFFSKKPPQKGPTPVREAPVSQFRSREDREERAAFSKIFRWRLPEGQIEAPQLVEVVGSFTRWQRVPLHRDGVLDAWHATIHHIPGNKTHHYMLLIDGKPTYDKTCDGLAVPHGFDEERYQLQTDKGMRVLMLFSQTK